MIIGITGKSGSGKSTVSKYIANLGYFVIDIDMIHKELAKKYDDEIEKIFNDHGFGALSKKDKIKEFFSNYELRKIINILLFSKTKESIAAILADSKEHVIFLDAPLLYDMHLDEMCDEIWYVHCTSEENVKRLMNRNGVTEEEAWHRYKAINFEDKHFTWELNTTLGIPEERIKEKILLLNK